MTAAISSAAVATASCTLGQGTDVGAQCALDETSFSVQLDGKSCRNAGVVDGVNTPCHARTVTTP